MNTAIHAIACAALVSLLLTACGSSPPVRYFSLSSTETNASQGAGDSVVLGLGPIRMPRYLDRSQIVVRGAGTEMQVDEFNRWAEPLAVAIHRVVSTDVDNMVEGVTVLAFPWEAAVQPQVDHRLLGEVIRFDAEGSGRVVLEIQWGILTVDTEEWPVQLHRTRYETQSTSPGDPAAMVLAMNEALADFSGDVAKELQAILNQ